MKARPLLLFLLGLAFLLAPGPACCEDKPHSTGAIANCFDGDTLRLVDRRVIRLCGIDAPEVPHGTSRPQYYSRQSRQILEGLGKGKQVTLVPRGHKLRDIHGRLLVDLILPDGSSINENLVEQGAAFFYPFPDLDVEFQKKLADLQADAIQNRRGFWDYILSLPIADRPYTGNRETLRFFPADCPVLEQIKPRNRVEFGNLMDAFLAGYAPARVCPFWPEEK